jgi:hypothetical protein
MKGFAADDLGSLEFDSRVLGNLYLPYDHDHDLYDHPYFFYHDDKQPTHIQ